MQTVPELPSSKLARELIATPGLVDTAIDLGIGLAAFDDISACIVCRGPYRRELEATAPRIRDDIHHTERFYYHEAIDYLLDVIRFSRELFLRDLDAGHPTQWSRGAKPLPPPKEFQRDYPAELRKIKAGVAQHFAERFPDRV
jgi:hypothetical protein